MIIMGKKTPYIAYLVLSVFLMGLYISTVAAAETWSVKEDQKLYYTFDKKSGETGLLAKQTKLCSGVIGITVEDIDTDGKITITCDTDFTGTEAIDIRDDIECDDKLFSGKSVFFSIDSWSVAFLYSTSGFTDAPTEWNNFLDFWKAMVSIFIPGSTFTKGEMSETQYEATITKENSSEMTYIKGVYTSDGILKSWNYYIVDEDGIKTETTITKNLLPLAFPNLYQYAAIGGVGLVLLIALCCCAKKKKK